MFGLLRLILPVSATLLRFVALIASIDAAAVRRAEKPAHAPRC